MAATPCDFHSLRSSLTCMARNFVLLAVLPAFLAVFAFAGLVEDVRESLSHQDFSSAQSALAAYKAKSGVIRSTWRPSPGWREQHWPPGSTRRPKSMLGRPRRWRRLGSKATRWIRMSIWLPR